jgi:hypothetical protein
MESINEHDRVVLRTDLPREKLTAGDVGTVGPIVSGRIMNKGHGSDLDRTVDQEPGQVDPGG